MTRGHSASKPCKVCHEQMLDVPARKAICDKCETPKQKKRREQMRLYFKTYKRKTPRVTSQEASMPIAQRLEESATRRRVPMCQACSNLPHARPQTGCPPRTLSVSGKLLTCGLPYCAEERIEAHSGGFSSLYGAQKYAMGGGT